MITLEDKINEALMKKMMTEKKTTLPSLRNQDWKNDKVETEKSKQIFPKYPGVQHHWTKRANLCGSKTSLW